MGRININTAPAFVLAQLPWMSYQGLPVTAPAGAAATQAVEIQQASAAYDPNLALTGSRKSSSTGDAQAAPIEARAI